MNGKTTITGAWTEADKSFSMTADLTVLYAAYNTDNSTSSEVIEYYLAPQAKQSDAVKAVYSQISIAGNVITVTPDVDVKTLGAIKIGAKIQGTDIEATILDINGKDVTDFFSFCCGSTVMPFCQLELDNPFPMTIEVLEDSQFFCIAISDLIELQYKYVEVMMLYNRLLIKALNEHWKLKQILNSYTAVQRYQWFLEEYPGLIGKVSNKYIASFLGMTTVTLSRLRRTLREKQNE